MHIKNTWPARTRAEGSPQSFTELQPRRDQDLRASPRPQGEPPSEAGAGRASLAPSERGPGLAGRASAPSLFLTADTTTCFQGTREGSPLFICLLAFLSAH